VGEKHSEKATGVNSKFTIKKGTTYIYTEQKISDHTHDAAGRKKKRKNPSAEEAHRSA